LQKQNFAFLCCHLTGMLLLQTKPSATGHAPDLHPLLQTILPHLPSISFSQGIHHDGGPEQAERQEQHVAASLGSIPCMQ